VRPVTVRETRMVVDRNTAVAALALEGPMGLTSGPLELVLPLDGVLHLVTYEQACDMFGALPEEVH